MQPPTARPAFPHPHQVAAYEFTTLTCVPGVIRYNGAKIQLLDLPGIIEGAKDGKGRGRQVIATARTCSLILIVLDCLKPITHKKLIEHELEGAWRGYGCGGVWGCGGGEGGLLRKGLLVRARGRGDHARGIRPMGQRATLTRVELPALAGFGLRLNKQPPEITFKKKEKGGINFTTTSSNPSLDLDGGLV